MEGKKGVRKTVIVIINQKTQNVQCFGSLKIACSAHSDLVYNTIVKANLPVLINNLKVYRVQFNKA